MKAAMILAFLCSIMVVLLSVIMAALAIHVKLYGCAACLAVGAVIHCILAKRLLTILNS